MSAGGDALEPGPDDVAQWLAQAAAVIETHLRALPSDPACGPLGAEGLALAQALRVPISETPLAGGMPEVLSRVGQAAHAGLSPDGPGYLAYIPGGGLPSSAIADLLASVFNRYTGMAPAAPALCQLEDDALRWLAAQFGYTGRGAAGLLTSGGSLANFSALVTARHRSFGDGGNFSEAVVYSSTQAHHSVRKAALLAGIPRAGVRQVATDARLRMDPAQLRAQINADLAAGRRPFAIVSAAGTTNTGAIDPLPEISATAAEHGLWHHVDAAYGGGFVLCPRGKKLLDGIHDADSITFDPHKGMFLPYGTGCLLVRDGEALRRAHGAQAEYLRDFDRLDRNREPPSPAEFGPELSRPYRGLSVWLPLVLHGAAAFRQAAAEKLALAERFFAGLQALVVDGAPIEIVDAPQLSIVPFRLARRTGEPLDAWNGRNARWLDAINGRQRVYLSSTTLPVAGGAALTLRVCVLSFRTHAPQVDAALEGVAATWPAHHNVV